MGFNLSKIVNSSSDPLYVTMQTVDTHWLAPVANSAALPTVGNNSGDARVTLDTSNVYIWTGAAWQVISGGGGGAVDSVNGQTGVVVLDNVDVGAAATLHNHQPGIVNSPTITEGTGGDAGKFSIASGTVWFYVDSTRTALELHTIAALSFTAPTDNVTTYICADRDTNTWVLLTDVTAIDYLRYVPYFIAFKRAGSTALHIQNIKLEAYGEVENNYHRTLHTDRYGRESGLDVIAVDGPHNITVNGGIIWSVHTPYTILPVTSATRQFTCASDGSVTSILNPIVNNTQYDNGSGLQTLSTNQWVINWVFRGIEDQDHLYIVLSTAYNSVDEAKAATTISYLPEIISSHALLIGRIIVEQGQDIAAGNIESAFSNTFAATTSITDHGNLSGLADDDHPQYAQKVSALDFEITDATKGLILKSANGTRFRITISNDGELTSTVI